MNNELNVEVTGKHWDNIPRNILPLLKQLVSILNNDYGWKNDDLEMVWNQPRYITAIIKRNKVEENRSMTRVQLDYGGVTHRDGEHFEASLT